MDNIDNQQATFVSYIAGLMEGEGSFLIIKCLYKGWLNYRGVVMLNNTDPDIIQEFVNYIESIGIKKWIKGLDRRPKNRRICYRVEIKQIDSRIKFIDSILPFMRSKTKIEQAKIVKEFSCYRKEQNQAKNIIRNNQGQFINGGHKKMTDKDKEYYERYLKTKESSETTRRIPHIFEGKNIVQTLTIEK